MPSPPHTNPILDPLPIPEGSPIYTIEEFTDFYLSLSELTITTFSARDFGRVDINMKR
ncbi:hypothetical protein J6590_097975 [Homalodisca vitripennis]|nr:hypothetical protein J6590_097975 [Homalodisca vitripennis]